MAKSNSRASDELRRALIRCVDLGLDSLESNLNGARSGFGLTDGELTAAQDLLGELRELVHSSAFVLRSKGRLDEIASELRYQDARERWRRTNWTDGFPKFRDAFLAKRMRRTKTNLAEIEELYKPTTRDGRAA